MASVAVVVTSSVVFDDVEGCGEISFSSSAAVVVGGPRRRRDGTISDESPPLSLATDIVVDEADTGSAPFRGLGTTLPLHTHGRYKHYDNTHIHREYSRHLVISISQCQLHIFGSTFVLDFFSSLFAL